MLLQDVTKILQVLLGAFQPIASQDTLTQRRIGQIGQVIGAVEDVAKAEGAGDRGVAARRVAEAHGIIHRVACILAMEDDEADDEEIADEAENSAADDAFEEDEDGDDEPLKEVAWDGKLEGETIELREDEGE